MRGTNIWQYICTYVFSRVRFFLESRTRNSKSFNVFILLNCLEARTEMIRRRRANANREQMVKTASDITENLLSVTRTMDNTVNQSAQSLQSLGRDGELNLILIFILYSIACLPGRN